MFSSSVTVEIGDGASTRFWTDAWLPAGAIPTFAPNLFKAVGRRRLGRSVKDALTDRHWAMLQDVQLRPLESDRFIWRWSADGQYSIRSAYRAYFVGLTSMAGAKELWRAAVPPKVTVDSGAEETAWTLVGRGMRLMRLA